MNVKICGIQSIEQALSVYQFGAWAVGFNFYKQSLRYIELEKARLISNQMPHGIKKVGIVEHISEDYDFLDMVQISRPNLSCIKTHLQIVLSIHVNDEKSLPSLKVLDACDYILIDAPLNGGVLGGTGRLSNWNIAQSLSKDFKLILAGGLNSSNVQKAIKYVKPYAVDVASGVEYAPGMKSEKKIKDFILRSQNA